jgi:hypothetical protein
MPEVLVLKEQEEKVPDTYKIPFFPTHGKIVVGETHIPEKDGGENNHPNKHQ